MITGLTVSPTIDCHKTKTKKKNLTLCFYTGNLDEVCMCVFFRALSSNSVFINPIHWLQSVHWAVKSNSSLDKYAAGVSFHTQTHLFLLFMGHKLGCLSLCSLQHEVNVSALQAHKKKEEKKENQARKQETKQLFLLSYFHRTSE